MKKTISLLAVIAVAGTAFATESAPSNTVGFTSFDVFGDYQAQICLQPLGTGLGLDPMVVFGDQFLGSTSPAGSDELRFFDGSNWTNMWRRTVGTFDMFMGTFTTVDWNKGYRYVSKHGDRTIVIAGDVIPEGTDVTIANIQDGLKNNVANPFPQAYQLAGAGAADVYDLLNDGFTGGMSPALSDAIIGIDPVSHGFQSAWFRTVPGMWMGTLTSLQPAMGYNIQDNTAGGGDYVWDYTIPAGGPVLSAPESSKSKAISAKDLK